MGQMILVNQFAGTNHANVTAGTQLNTKPIPMQLDQMNWKLAADMGGASPYDSWWLRTMQGVGTLSILKLDQLVDTVSGAKYRVFGRPMVYQQSYVKVPVEQVEGT
jgi:hypothetical protein